ncbi:nucleolin 1-like [Mercurialis annua]|uniref:nucleolin 1-like n=1 Tax=Mercurialis annua TaxID=3986 RepID=UPI0024AD5427|nr:nucleolin 1-like [Mercurialis annua]
MGLKSVRHRPESSHSSAETDSETSNHDIDVKVAESRHGEEVASVETAQPVESSKVTESAEIREEVSSIGILVVEEKDTVEQPNVLEIAKEALSMLSRSPKPTLTKSMIIESRLKLAAAVKNSEDPKAGATDLQDKDETVLKPALRSSKRTKISEDSSIAAELAKLKASYNVKKPAKRVSFEKSKEDSRVAESVVPEKNVIKKSTSGAKRKVSFESINDDNVADKTVEKSPIKKKVIKSAASTKRKASIKTSEHEEVQEEKSMKAYKTRATSSSGKKQVSTETSESEKVVDDVSIKAPKTRSTPGSSKKKSYTESTESEKVLDDGSIKTSSLYYAHLFGLLVGNLETFLPQGLIIV